MSICWIINGIIYSQQAITTKYSYLGSYKTPAGLEQHEVEKTGRMAEFSFLDELLL